VIQRLRGMSYQERANNNLHQRRGADLVLAGCAILDAIRDAFPLPRLRVADRGLREGMLVEIDARGRRAQGVLTGYAQKTARAAECQPPFLQSSNREAGLGGLPDLVQFLIDLLSSIVGQFERHVGDPMAALQNSSHGLTQHVTLYGCNVLRRSAGPQFIHAGPCSVQPGAEPTGSILEDIPPITLAAAVLA